MGHLPGGGSGDGGGGGSRGGEVYIGPCSGGSEI